MSAFQRGNIEAALRFMSRACINPEAPAIWHRNHAEILDRCGNAEAAETAARLAVRRESDCTSAWETLGTILIQRGLLAESCECYAKAVQIEPTFLQALNNLAVTLDRLGQLEAAEARFKQALHVAPESAEIQLNFATLLGELGRYREGLEIVRQVLDRCPNMMRAHAIASEFKRNSGRRTSAQTRVERALAIAPIRSEILPRRSAYPGGLECPNAAEHALSDQKHAFRRLSATPPTSPALTPGNGSYERIPL
jgi:tetratricopeptide (TPR) repeat protein